MKMRFLFLLFFSFSMAPAYAHGNQVPTSPDDEASIKSAFFAGIFRTPDLTRSLDGRPVIVGAVHFDGTRNDAANVPVGERMTIVGHLAKVTSGSQLGFHHYRAGPGTGPGFIRPTLDSAIGYTSRRTAEEVAEKVLVDVANARKGSPNADVRILVTGFSRGSALARHFMNVVHERWHADSRSGEEPKFYALIFDTVATGQRDRMKLNVPQSVDLLYHFVSSDERRRMFKPSFDLPDDQAPGRIVTIELPGVHSDVGASYATGLGSAYVARIDALVGAMGLSDTVCHVVAGDAFAEGKHDSRWPLEKILGIGAPNTPSSPEVRGGHQVSNAPLSPDDARQWRARMLALASRKGSCIDSSSVVTPSFSVRRTEGGFELQSLGPLFLPSAQIVDMQGRTYLTYTLDGSYISRAAIPDSLLQRMRKAGAVRLDLRVRTSSHGTELWWFVNGERFGKAE